MLKRILLRSLLLISGLVALIALSIFILLQLPLPEALQPNPIEESLLVKGVHIVDLEGDSLIQDQAIYIQNGQIVAVGKLDSIGEVNEAKVLNGEGKYVIPALWDMHTHWISSQAPQLNMPLFMAAGVTQIRDLGGGTDQEIKDQWQEDIKAGKLLGPRVGSQAAFILNYLKDEEEARGVNERVENKAHFIKTYNALLPHLYDIMAEEAKKEGIEFMGHKPRAISTEHCVKMGHKTLEHARVFLYDCFPGSADLQEEYRARISGEKEGGGPIIDTKMRQRMVDEHDPQMFADLVEVIKAYGSWYVPTHLTRKMDAMADDEEYLNDPRLKYISMAQQFAWREDTEGMVKSDPSPEGRKAFMDFYEKGLEISGVGYDLGLPILAGTDANDTYCIPGLGLHEELRELVKGGLAPNEALITATLNPARFYGWESEMGTLEAGKIADFILLNENPLEDIRHTEGIFSLINRGAIYSREELDQMLKYVEENAGSLSLNAKLIKEKI
ncbi:MAG: amidohydrolase family protein [Bacteroidia bacterium]|nr:amidohydrolase family protein [Bacteroidia bacterium]